MENADMIRTVQQLCGFDDEATGSVVALYLFDAKFEIMRRLYPFGYENDQEIPERYQYLQCKLASRYFLRRGAEGEIAHSENGINRTYASVNDEDLLSEIVPYAKVT